MTNKNHPIDKLVDSLNKGSSEINSALKDNNIELKEYEHSNRFYTVNPDSDKRSPVSFDGVKSILESYFSQDSVDTPVGSANLEAANISEANLEAVEINSVDENTKYETPAVKKSDDVLNVEEQPKDIMDVLDEEKGWYAEGDKNEVGYEQPERRSFFGRIGDYIFGSKVDNSEDDRSDTEGTSYEPISKIGNDDLGDEVKERVNKVIAEANEQLKSAKNDYDILEVQYSTLEKTLGTKDEELSGIKGQLEESKGQLEKSKGQLEESSNKMNGLEGEINEYESLINDDETLQKVQKERDRGPWYTITKVAVAGVLIAGVGFGSYMYGKDNAPEPETKVEYVTKEVTKEVPVEKIVEREVIKTVPDTAEVNRLNEVIGDLNSELDILQTTYDSTWSAKLKKAIETGDSSKIEKVATSYVRNLGSVAIPARSCEDALRGLYKAISSSVSNEANQIVFTEKAKNMCEEINPKYSHVLFNGEQE